MPSFPACDLASNSCIKRCRWRKRESRFIPFPPFPFCEKGSFEREVAACKHAKKKSALAVVSATATAAAAAAAAAATFTHVMVHSLDRLRRGPVMRRRRRRWGGRTRKISEPPFLFSSPRVPTKFAPGPLRTYTYVSCCCSWFQASRAGN